MKHRVLIVDDNAEVVYMLSLLLREAGYDVIEAFDGSEGLEKAKKYHPDIILLDVQMPKMNGYEVASELRKDERMNNIPIIIVTSFITREDMSNAVRAGADGHIAKPIDPLLFVPEMVLLVQDFYQKQRA